MFPTRFFTALSNSLTIFFSSVILVFWDFSKKIVRIRKSYREELRIAVGMSSATLAKLGKNEIVSMEVLGRICEELKCDVGDIVSNKSDVKLEKKNEC